MRRDGSNVGPATPRSRPLRAARPAVLDTIKHFPLPPFLALDVAPEYSAHRAEVRAGAGWGRLHLGAHGHGVRGAGPPLSGGKSA